ncbi:MAG: hypothetical protein WAO00_12430, partial [Chthoniobacterales bacterium]
MEYFLHIAIFTGIFAILAISLDLVAGHIGVLSMSHAAFYGLGAYGSVLAATYLGISFLACTLVGMLIAVLTSLIVSFPSLRLHGDYLVIATFAFQVILFS